MFKKLVEENIIITISSDGNLLIEEDDYCEFMRDIILNTSGLN